MTDKPEPTAEHIELDPASAAQWTSAWLCAAVLWPRWLRWEPTP